MINNSASDSSTDIEANSGLMFKITDSDLWHSFKNSKVTVVSVLIVLVLVLSALLAPLIAPYDPFDTASISLWSADLAPMQIDDEDNLFLLGTDNQGRDILSLIMYGMRTSLIVGIGAIVFAAILGTMIGILSAYRGGWVDGLLMRIADVQLSFPAILVALLINGIAKATFSASLMDDIMILVLILSIGLAEWVPFARAVRGAAMVEINKEYIQAARIMGLPTWRVLLKHLLPNVVNPIVVISTISLALAIITEATLSFLGVGMPQTEPSLGTLIKTGANFLMSGEWWITLFPGITLVCLVLSVNLVGDWLRDALNPRLK